ncbi:MAG TPA: ABC transporter permease [Terriglobia bacterium]
MAGRLALRTTRCPLPAVVLSYVYWRKTFGGDRSVIGRVIHLNGMGFTVVGVTEPHFTNLAPGKSQDFFLTLSSTVALKVRWMQPEVLTDTQDWWLVILGRLRSGISMGQAQADATSIFRNHMLHGANPLSREADDPSIVLTAAQEGLSGRRRTVSSLLYVLMAVVELELLLPKRCLDPPHGPAGLSSRLPQVASRDRRPPRTEVCASQRENFKEKRFLHLQKRNPS